MIMITYLKKNIDLTVALVFALLTAVGVPFSWKNILEEMNIPLLFLLFCMMAVVAGFRRSGVFFQLSRIVFAKADTARQVIRILIFICFFSSMIITNDMALITFVPMTVIVLKQVRLRGYYIFTIVMQTVAANLGSMFTPIGNPQNLYIYSFYRMRADEFLFYTGPTVLLSAILLYGATYYVAADRKIEMPVQNKTMVPTVHLYLLYGLFFLCVLTVLRIVSAYSLFFVVVPTVLVLDKKIFFDIDYKLLLLFVFLFIGVGNLSQITIMQTWAVHILNGHEFFISLLLSQILSNVPAAVLLSHYTNDIVPLLLGVNIGGLGTIIASMASIISFKVYTKLLFSRKNRYLIVFTAVNMGMLLIILGVQYGLKMMRLV
jgi:Na+/H+ antiporter NhaD/arsenite permease-like protein